MEFDINLPYLYLNTSRLKWYLFNIYIKNTIVLKVNVKPTVYSDRHSLIYGLVFNDTFSSISDIYRGATPTIDGRQIKFPFYRHQQRRQYTTFIPPFFQRRRQIKFPYQRHQQRRQYTTYIPPPPHFFKDGRQIKFPFQGHQQRRQYTHITTPISPSKTGVK